MDTKEVKSVIEALLFTWGDPLNISDIANILEMDKKELHIIMQEMMDDFDYNMRGIRIIKINNSYQLGTRAEHYEWVKKLANQRAEKALSNAALETLSIIAYRQPVIKSDIEAIRGVRCDKVIETLLEKLLIEEVGRMDRVGRPILYGTTELFLKSFGLECLKDLPVLKDSIDEDVIKNNT